MPGDSRLLALQSRANPPVIAGEQPGAQSPEAEAKPEEKNLLTWLKTIFSERQPVDGGDEVPVEDDLY